MNNSQQGFDPQAFVKLYEWEAGNFWFRARNDRIIYLMNKYLSNPETILEVGCGTGFVLEAIGNRYPNAKVIGSELFPEGLEFAKKRNPSLNLIQFDARNLPYESEFDAIGMFDVLEHINEDLEVLNQCHKAIKPGGKLFISVPQHMSLWSAVDEIAHHVRRYSRKELIDKVEKSGFKVLYSNSFNSLLFPLMFISRFFQKKKANPGSEFNISPFMNKTLKFILNIEFGFVKLGIRFPMGGSLVLVAEKK